MMILTGLEIEFLIYDSNSLKEKRRVVLSMVEKMQHRFRVSAAEVDKHDMLNIGVVGFGIVSNNRVFSRKVLQQIVNQVEEDYPIEIINYEWYEAQ